MTPDEKMNKQLLMYKLADALRNNLFKRNDEGYIVLDISYPFNTGLGTIRIKDTFKMPSRYVAIGMVKDYLIDNGFINKDYWKARMSDDCIIVSKETIDNLITYFKLKGDIK